MAFAGPSPLAALLAARAGGGGSSGAAGGPPQPNLGVQQDPSDSGGDASVTALVGRAIDLVTQAASAEKDPIEREGLAKIVALLHGFSAREQKQRDAAMGAGPAVQLMRRQQG